MVKPLLVALLLASPAAFADTITVTTTTTIETGPPAVLQPPALAPTTDTAPREAPLTTPEFRLTAAAGPALGFDTKDDCAAGECVGVHLQVGGPIASHLLLIASLELMEAPDGKDRHHVETISLQRWITSRLWGELGIGVGSKRTWNYPEPPTMDLSGVAPAGTAAVGYELVRRATYSFGIQTRFASTTDIHHTSFGQLMAGISWL